MNKKTLVTSIAVGAILLGATMGYAGSKQTHDIPFEQQKQLDIKIESNLDKVAVDLKKEIPSDYIEIRYDKKTEADKLLSNLPEGERKELMASAIKEVQNHGIVGYWLPTIFVKPNGTEYILAFKNVESGQNDFVRVKKEGKSFELVEKKQKQGAKVNSTVGK